MYPELFSIGPLTLHTYGLFVAIGLVVGILVTIRIGRSQGIDFQQIMDMGFIIIFTGIIGSRLAYVLMNFSYYKTNPMDIVKLWHGGLVFSGGLIAVLFAIVMVCPATRLQYMAVRRPMGTGSGNRPGYRSHRMLYGRLLLW